MVKVNDKIHFSVSKKDVITHLNNSSYRGKFKIYDSFFKQGDKRWKRGEKYKFQESLIKDNLYFFAYIKFYLDSNNEKYALVAGKSGTKKVNKSSGCDLSFSTNVKHGPARSWLFDNNKKWCETEILIVRPNAIGQDSKREAFEIESYLQKTFDLWGS